MRRKFHPFTLSVVSREEGEDYGFVFSSLKNVLLKLLSFNYVPSHLIADGAGAITNGYILAFGSNFARLMCSVHLDTNCKKN